MQTAAVVVDNYINWTQIIINLIIIIPATVAALGAWKSSRKTHKSVNGEMEKYKKMLADSYDAYRRSNNLTHERKDDAKNSDSDHDPVT